jgi:hypothetical protein
VELPDVLPDIDDGGAAAPSAQVAPAARYFIQISATHDLARDIVPEYSTGASAAL